MTESVQQFRSKTIALLAIVLAIFLFVMPASGLMVTGAKYMGSIKPGGSDTYPITVSIGADEAPLDMVAGVMEFGQAPDQSYSPITTSDSRPYSAKSMIVLDPGTIHIEPGKNATITAKITLPANTGAGGRYALIYLQPKPGAAQVVTTGAIIPVMITVAGTTPSESGTIKNINIGAVTPGQPVKIITTFENTGNYHYYHTVNSITLKDAGGNTIASESTEPSAHAIIPGNSIEYIVNMNLPQVSPGTYTATSRVLLENGKALDEKTTTFTVNTNYIPPIAEANISLSPASAGTLSSSDGRISVSFPQGAVLGDAVVTLKPYSKEKLKAAPGNAKLGATTFEITGLTGLLNKEATVQVKYSDDDLAAAGNDASQLKLAYYDAARNAWVILPTQVDSQAKTLTSVTNHLSVWAVMASSSTTSSPSATTTTQGTPLPLTTILASLGLVVIVVGYQCRNRK